MEGQEQQGGNPASVIGMFGTQQEQEQAAALFNTRLGGLHDARDREKALKDIVISIRRSAAERERKQIEEGLQESEGQEQKEEGLIDKAKSMLTTVSTFSADMVKKAKNLMTGFLHALALMVVTACVIPIAVILLFLWMVKLVFQLGFAVGMPEFRGRKEFL